MTIARRIDERPIFVDVQETIVPSISQCLAPTFQKPIIYPMKTLYDIL